MKLRKNKKPKPEPEVAAAAVEKPTEETVKQEEHIIASDFRDAKYPEVCETKTIRDAILDGKLQVVSTHNPFLVRVSDLQLTEMTIEDDVFVKGKIYKII